MMRATLAEYLAMTPAQAARVTHLDLTEDESVKFWRGWGDAEEWPGEAVATGLPPAAGGGE